MRAVDDEIRDAERRLARRRSGVSLLARDWAEALRDVLVSGRSLIGVAAVGFAVGEMLRPSTGGGRAAGRGGGKLLALASFLLRVRFGFPWWTAWSALQSWRRPRSHGAPTGPA